MSIEEKAAEYATRFGPIASHFNTARSSFLVGAAARQPEIDALKARIEELESGSGEPVAWRYRQAEYTDGPLLWGPWHPIDTMLHRDVVQGHIDAGADIEMQSLYIDPPAPVVVLPGLPPVIAFPSEFQSGFWCGATQYAKKVIRLNATTITLAELEGLRKNDARYRFLRDDATGKTVHAVTGPVGVWGECGHSQCDGDTLDYVIDAAMEGKQP